MSGWRSLEDEMRRLGINEPRRRPPPTNVYYPNNPWELPYTRSSWNSSFGNWRSLEDQPREERERRERDREREKKAIEHRNKIEQQMRERERERQRQEEIRRQQLERQKKAEEERQKELRRQQEERLKTTGRKYLYN